MIPTNPPNKAQTGSDRPGSQWLRYECRAIQRSIRKFLVMLYVRRRREAALRILAFLAQAQRASKAKLAFHRLMRCIQTLKVRHQCITGFPHNVFGTKPHEAAPRYNVRRIGSPSCDNQLRKCICQPLFRLPAARGHLSTCRLDLDHGLET